MNCVFGQDKAVELFWSRTFAEHLAESESIGEKFRKELSTLLDAQDEILGVLNGYQYSPDERDDYVAACEAVCSAVLRDEAQLHEKHEEDQRNFRERIIQAHQYDFSVFMHRLRTAAAKYGGTC